MFATFSTPACMLWELLAWPALPKRKRRILPLSEALPDHSVTLSVSCRFYRAATFLAAFVPYPDPLSLTLKFPRNCFADLLSLSRTIYTARMANFNFEVLHQERIPSPNTHSKCFTFDDRGGAPPED